jgi:diguanylate cyclase (GGDEF)-like protein/PAS domain S-box-containing protein
MYVQAHRTGRRGVAIRTLGCMSMVSLATILIRFAPQSNHVIWIANGILLAYLFMTPRRLWPLYLAAGFAAEFAASFLTVPHWQHNLLFNLLNLAEVSIGGWLLRAWSPGLPRFTDRTYLVRFVMACVVAGPLLTGLVYAVICSLWLHLAPGPLLLKWTMADALGMGVAAPACVALLRGRFRQNNKFARHWVYLAALLLVTVAAFLINSVFILFAVFPLLILLLLRVGLGWATLSTLLVAGTASFYTQCGIGPFAQANAFSPLDPVLGLQTFVLSAMFLMYTVSLVIESRRATERRLQKIAAQHALVTENSRDIIVLADFDGRRRYVSAAARDMLGWSERELWDRPSIDLLHPEDRANAAETVKQLRAGAEDATLESRVMKRGGDFIWVEANLRLVRDPVSGKPSGLLNIVRDISERKRAEQARTFHVSLLDAIHDVSLDGILVVNEKGFVVSYNKRFSDVWKLPLTELPVSLLEANIEMPDAQILGRCVELAKDPESFMKRVQDLYAYPEEDDYCQFELRDGRVLERYSSGLRSETGKHLGRVWFFRDITERKRAEQLLRDAYRAVETLSVTDPLTGLANRRQFDQSLAVEWRRTLRDRRPLSMLLMDVDQFKSFNDTYGHVRGDTCLKEIAGATQDAVTRPGDIVARIGGEEFAIILPNTGNDGAMQVANTVCAAIRDRAIPHAGSSQGRVTVSIGCATILTSLGLSSIALIEMADRALYQAKREGRNRVCNGAEDRGEVTSGKTA